MTPITWRGTPSIRISRPTMPRSAPNRRRQRPSLRTTTASLPGRSSSGRKARPSTGVTPSSWKKSQPTRAPVTFSGTSEPARLTLAPAIGTR